MYLQLCASLASATFWTISYNLIKYQWKLQAEWACRLLTAVHALLVTALAGFAMLFGPNPFTSPGGPNTMLQEVTLVITLGYFMFDMTWCLYHQTEGKTMLLHHAVSLLAISRVLMKGFSGSEAVAGIFGLEITNPLLQARWFLRSTGYKGTNIYKFTELTFMGMFLIFRLIWGTCLVYTTVMHPLPDFEGKVEAVAFYALSWAFIVFIVQYFIAKYIKQPQSKVCTDNTDSGKKTS